MRPLRLLSALVLLALAALSLWLVVALELPYGDYPSEGMYVEIPRGATKRGIARLLEEKGVIRSRLAFELLARWRSGQVLQAGEYFFNRPESARAVFEAIAAGRVHVFTVVVPEGATMFEIAGRVAQTGLLTREEFLAAAGDSAAIRELAPRARNLEGFLFPATYEFSRHVRAQQIVDAMVRRFRETWSSFPEGGRNPYGVGVLEVVTLASMVERETPKADERPIIAGIFYNRLRRGFALQCDPTVLYAMQLAHESDTTIHQSDLHLDSPYNTYRYRGLPPGPIASPGRASLVAALYPPYVDYLYFVANTEGGHFFSKTLEEHKVNVSRYRRLATDPASSRAPREDLPGKPPGARPRR